MKWGRMASGKSKALLGSKLELRLEEKITGQIRLERARPPLPDEPREQYLRVRVPAGAVRGVDRPVEFEFPMNLPEWIDDAADASAALPGLPLPARTPRAAVFVNVPHEQANNPWEALLRHSLEDIGVQSKYEIIRRRHGQARQPNLPELPLRVLAVEGGPLVNIAASAFLPEIFGYDVHSGIEVVHCRRDEVGAAARSASPAVVVADTEDLPFLFAKGHRGLRGSTSRPRVVFGVGAAPDSSDPAEWLPPGVSAVIPGVVGEQENLDFAHQFATGVFQDLPIHVAVGEAKAVLPEEAQERGVQVTTDPIANRGFRIREAIFSQIEATTAELAMGATPEPGPAYDGVFDDLGTPLSPDFQRVQSHGREIFAAVEAGADVLAGSDESKTYFDLFPLKRQLDAAASQQEVAAADAESALENASAEEAKDVILPRHVDIGLWRADRPATGGSNSTWLRRKTTLARGRNYQLRFHIGRRAVWSLFETPPPGIDGFMPKETPEGGFLLHVSLEPIDFAKRGIAVKTVRLPHRGRSDVLSFPVRTPARLGPAELRLTVSLGNHLLQSFVVRALIAGEESPTEDPSLTAELLYSRTKRIDDEEQLANLSERALQLSLGSTHQLGIKRGLKLGGVQLGPTAIAKATSRYRELLDDATRDGDDWRFVTRPGDAAVREDDFAEYIGHLARVGQDLYHSLFEQADEGLERALDEIKNSEDETIQVIRYGSNTVFPWAAVYDFKPPREDSRTPGDYCRGWRLDDEGQLAACQHGPQDRVACGRGFWGTRHRIEELLLSGSTGHSVTHIDVPAPRKRVHLAVGIDDPPSRQLEVDLMARLPEDVYVLKPEDNLLDLLFDDATRPALWIGMGHHDRVSAKYQDDEEQMLLNPEPRPLDTRVINERRTESPRWASPAPVVLLMACESAAIQPDSLTQFARSFLKAGATAVVGTEVKVSSGLVSRVALETATAMVAENQTLGASITRARRTLLSEWNPLGFVFSAIGESDAHL